MNSRQRSHQRHQRRMNAKRRRRELRTMTRCLGKAFVTMDEAFTKAGEAMTEFSKAWRKDFNVLGMDLSSEADIGVTLEGRRQPDGSVIYREVR